MSKRDIFGCYTLEELVEIMELSFTAGIRWADWSLGNDTYNKPPPDRETFVNGIIGEAYRKLEK